MNTDKAKKETGTLYVCDKEGNNAEPLNANDKPYPREDALYCDVDPDRQGVLLREAKASDDVSASVDYVATGEDGKIVGYFKWVPTT